jgi:fatty-acyl-CoA synthase
VTVITTDSIAESVNFVERLETALPDLAQQKDARAVQVTAAPKLRNVVLFGSSTRPGFVSEADFTAAGEDVAERTVHERRLRVRVRDVALMLYTSGTTANPKGCLITHEAQVRNSIALGRHRYRLTHRDSMWSPLPMFHIAAVLPMLAIFDVGGTYLTMGYFDPGVALRMLEDYKVTAAYPSFVTIMQGLIYHPDFPKRNLKSLRLMNSNFAVQPPGVAEPIMAAMPDAIQVGSFGMTEASGTVCTGSPDEPESGASRASGGRCRDSRCASSIPRPSTTCTPACAARCSCAATACSRATTATRSRARRRSTATAGSTPATSARSTPTARSCSTAASRTC